MMSQLKSSDWYKKIIRENKFLFQTISDATGKNVTDLVSLEYIYDNLKIETFFNYKLPAWTENVYPDPMKSLADLSFSLACYNTELARLKIGKHQPRYIIIILGYFLHSLMP